MQFVLLALLALIAFPAYSDVTRPATYAEFYTGIVPSADPNANGAALAAAVGAHDYIYLPRGKYALPNPVVIARDTPLFVHCADRMFTHLVAQDPSQPMFVVVNAPLVNLTGCLVDPTNTIHFSPSTAELNSVAIRTVNALPIQLELQDLFAVHTQFEFAGPGSYRVQNCSIGGRGVVRASITLDHPLADLLVFGGGMSNGPWPSRVGEAYHVWQKRGRFRIYSAGTGGGLGPADFRIESRSELGPHVIANVRSEGVNGDLNETGAISRLVYVPPTSEAVDIVIKNAEGAWITGPGRFSDDNWNDDSVDVVNDGPDTLTVTGHPFANGEGPVRASGSFHGLSSTTSYYVHVIDGNTVSRACTRPVRLRSQIPAGK